MAFPTKIGLGQHRRLKHRGEINSELNVPSKKARWSRIDVELLARTEASLTSESRAVPPGEINRQLAGKVPDRTLEAIKCLRRQSRYKELVINEKRKRREDVRQPGPPAKRLRTSGSTECTVECPSTQSQPPLESSHSLPAKRPRAPPSPGESVSPMPTRMRTSGLSPNSSTMSETGEQPRGSGIREQLVSLKATMVPTTTLAKDMIKLIDLIELGMPFETHLDGFLKKHFSGKVRSASIPKCSEGNKQTSKRLKRREDFAKMQNLFKLNRSSCAKMVLDGCKRCNIEDDEGFVNYWADMMTTTVDPKCSADTNVLDDVWVEDEKFSNMANPITITEVKEALQGKAKAIGPDGVDLRHLRSVPIAILTCLMNVLYLSRVPNQLRPARLAFIPKTDGASSPDLFRPIAVGSYVQRVLNKVLAKRMQSSVEISGVQRAFRPFDGTFENLAIADTLVLEARRRRRELRLTSLDLRKAFDMVKHNSILESLRRRGYPKLFVQYVENLYAQGLTIVQYGTRSKTISPTRGVRQGDPLSPLMFNLVMDEVLTALEVENVGVPLSENERVCALGFADDLILATESKLSMQHLLDKAIPMFRDRGLEINSDKSFTISFVPVGKVKKIKVLEVPEFRVGDNVLPCKAALAPWKYLGVYFDDLGRVPAAAAELKTLLDRVSRAPLRPYQRLVILKDYLFPRFIYRLVAGPCPSASRLISMDLLIRRVVKKSWLKMDASTPNGFLYSHISEGGLDLPCFQTLIPRLRLGRMSHLQRSEYSVIKWLCQTESFIRDLAKTRVLCRSTGAIIENVKQETKYWAAALHNTYDGSNLKSAHNVPWIHSWVRGMPYLSGKEFINLLKVRINALPTRARMGRGRPWLSRDCRHGCGQVETLSHVSQLCTETHRMTVKRHDDVCLRVSILLRKLGYTVSREQLLKPVGRPRLKPDLIVSNPQGVWVLDVEIPGISRDLDKAYKDKVSKYNVPEIQNLLPCPELPRFFGAITVSMTGMWSLESFRDLGGLGVSKRSLTDLTVLVVQGTLRIFRGHQAHKSVRRSVK